MTTSTESTRRRGWFGRLFDAIFGPRPEEEPEVEEPPPGALILKKDMVDPIRVPALGDAFDFQIRAVFTWHSEGLTAEELRYWVDRYSSRVRRTLRDAVADEARTYAPHRARELQVDLNRSFATRSWSHTEDGVALRYTVRLRVDPDDAVRDQLRPFWEKRIQMECEHDLGMRRAELVDALTKQWSSILERLQEDPHNRHAARLSEEEFARVLGDFVSERREGIRQIIDLLQEAVDQQGTLGLGPSEYMRAWDAALKAFRLEYGFDKEAAADGANGKR